MTGPGNTLPESDTSWREIWHYRRELLPPGVSYQQVDFEFITKKGYGKNVLQRDEHRADDDRSGQERRPLGRAYARKAAK